MKIAITSTGPTLEHMVGTRSDCCDYLFIIDPNTMEYERMPNPVVALRGPAAQKMFTQLMLQGNVSAFLTGGCDTKILKELSDAGIAIIIVTTGSVNRAVKRFRHSYNSVA